MESFLFNTQDCNSLQPKTLLNPLSMFLWECFEVFASKTLKLIYKSAYKGVASWQVCIITIWNLLTNSKLHSRYFAWNFQKRKMLQKMFENFFKNLCKTVPFSLFVFFIKGLEARIFYYNNDRLQETLFLWLFWSSWKFSRKRSKEKSIFQSCGITI